MQTLTLHVPAISGGICALINAWISESLAHTTHWLCKIKCPDPSHRHHYIYNVACIDDQQLTYACVWVATCQQCFAVGATLFFFSRCLSIKMKYRYVLLLVLLEKVKRERVRLLRLWELPKYSNIFRFQKILLQGQNCKKQSIKSSV